MRVLEAKHSLDSPFQEIELGWIDFDFRQIPTSTQDISVFTNSSESFITLPTMYFKSISFSRSQNDKHCYTLQGWCLVGYDII